MRATGVSGVAAIGVGMMVGSAVDARFCAVRSLEDAILTKTAIKSMAFIIGDGDIFDGLTQTKLSYGWLNRSRAAYSPEEGDYFHGFVEGSALCPSRFELGNDTNTQPWIPTVEKSSLLTHTATTISGSLCVLMKN